MADINCPKCGALQDDENKVCTECGGTLPSFRQKGDTSPNPYSPAYAAPNYDAPPPSFSRFSVLGVWGFIGNMLVMAIPFIGVLVALIWAFGGCKNQNRRNHARAFLVLFLLAAFLLLFILFWAEPSLKPVIDSIKEALPYQ